MTLVSPGIASLGTSTSASPEVTWTRWQRSAPLTTLVLACSIRVFNVENGLRDERFDSERQAPGQQNVPEGAFTMICSSLRRRQQLPHNHLEELPIASRLSEARSAADVICNPALKTCC